MKKVVLEHTQGPFAGQHQILGQLELLVLGGLAIPESLEHFEAMGRHVEFASLINVGPRVVLYREAFPKPTGRLGQTMETWHPEQR